MISDVEFDKYCETVDAEKLYADMKLIVKCPNCERLHVFWDGWNKPQIIYKQEDYCYSSAEEFYYKVQKKTFMKAFESVHAPLKSVHGVNTFKPFFG